MPDGSGSEKIIRQLETLLIFLERPTIQWQLAAIAISLLLAALASRWLSSVTRKIALRNQQDRTAADQDGAVQRWLPAIEQVYFPAVAFGILGVMLLAFDRAGQPGALLQGAMKLFSVVAGYRVFLALLYLLFPNELVRRYAGRVLTPLFVLYLIGSIAGYLVDVNLLSLVSVATVFDSSITLGNLVSALVIFYLFLVASWVVNDGIRIVTDRRVTASPGVVNAVQTIARYAIVTVGVVVGLGLLGLDLTTLTVIAGGLSIGIGFGLQHVVGSFISGIWLLFEQTLRPGDIVEVDGKRGTVQKLSIRSTTVRTFDNVELVIPNQQFLTSPITTYTGSSLPVRISIQVGVSYDNDPQEVQWVMLELAKEHELVMEDPAPAFFFTEFGDSSLDLRLDVWVEHPDKMLRVRSDLNLMVWEAFARHGIEIPFPQRDINLGRGWEQLLNGSKPRGESRAGR